MTNTTLTIPSAGDQHTFHELRGYKPVQNRPLDCRRGCICGTCNGVETKYVEEVREVIFWADNSIEVFSVTGKIDRLSAPSGDRCF